MAMRSMTTRAPGCTAMWWNALLKSGLWRGLRATFICVRKQVGHSVRMCLRL